MVLSFFVTLTRHISDMQERSNCIRPSSVANCHVVPDEDRLNLVDAKQI